MMEAPKEELPVLFVVYGNSKDRSPYLRAMSFWSFPFLFGVNGSSKDRSPYPRAMMEAPNEGLPVLSGVYGSSKDRSPYLRAMMGAPNEASLFFSVYMVAARTEVLICGQ